MKIEKTSTPQPRAGRAAGGSGGLPLVSLPAEALDDRIAIVGAAGSGKTYAAKGFVERLLERGARVAIVDPLGVWWGLRASADGGAPVMPWSCSAGATPTSRSLPTWGPPSGG